MIKYFGTKPGFSLTLDGGEKRADRDKAIQEGLDKLLSDGINLPIIVKHLSWYKREQRKGSSLRWIAIGTSINSNQAWVARIVTGKEKDEPFCEIRGLHLLEVPCRQTSISPTEVPTEVKETLKDIFTLPTSSYRRLTLLREGQVSKS